MALESLTDNLGELRKTLAELERLHDIASAIQWEKSPAPPAARDDTSERSVGGPVSNPTLDIVADGRRLQVREEVQRADRFAVAASHAARTVRTRLDEAVKAWEGAG